MAKDPGTGIEQLREVAAASNLRSPLARWLSANHDEFDQLLKDFRPKWEALIEQWSVDGLLTLPPDFATNEPTRRKTVKAAMRTWDRVRAKVAKKRKLDRRLPQSRQTTITRPTREPDVRSNGVHGGGFRHDNKPATAEDAEKWGPAKK